MALAYIEAAAAPLDGLRRRAFRWVATMPALRTVVYRRDTRIAVQACAGIALASALAVVAPIAVMAVSPALFGVPHVVSDLRYLVARRRLARPWLARSPSRAPA